MEIPSKLTDAQLRQITFLFKEVPDLPEAFFETDEGRMHIERVLAAKFVIQKFPDLADENFQSSTTPWKTAWERIKPDKPGEETLSAVNPENLKALEEEKESSEKQSATSTDEVQSRAKQYYESLKAKGIAEEIAQQQALDAAKGQTTGTAQEKVSGPAAKTERSFAQTSIKTETVKSASPETPNTAMEEKMRLIQERAEINPKSWLKDPIGAFQEGWVPAFKRGLGIRGPGQTPSEEIPEASSSPEQTSSVNRIRRNIGRQPTQGATVFEQSRQGAAGQISETGQGEQKTQNGLRERFGSLVSRPVNALNSVAVAIKKSPSIQSAATSIISWSSINARRGAQFVFNSDPVGIGATIGAISGVILFPQAPLLAFVGGSTLGSMGGLTYDQNFGSGGGSRRQDQSVLGNLGGLARTAGLAQRVIGGFGALFGGSSAGSVAAISIVAVIILMLLGLILVGHIVPQIFYAQAESPDLQGAPPLFTVAKAPDINQMENFKTADPKTTPSKKVKYTVTFDPQGQNLKVTITDDVKVITQNGQFDKNQIQAVSSANWPTTIGPSNSTVSYTISIPVNTFNQQNLNDGLLVNTISVVGQSSDGKSETRVAQAIVKIGNPPGSTPYGFPKSGQIATLDEQFITGQPGIPDHAHCGEILYPGQSCFPGGLDIGGGGDVRSTHDGLVTFSAWDERHGGLVIIVAGDYYVAFMHLNKDDLISLGPVHRGDKIGSVFTNYPLPGTADYSKCPPGPPEHPGLCTSSGPHVHYQVLKGGNNLDFSNPINAGKCSAGKIEPKSIDDHPNIDAGPFTCD